MRSLGSKRFAVFAIAKPAARVKTHSVVSAFHATTTVLFCLSLGPGTAAAQSCRDAITAEKAEWRSLTKGNRSVPPAMRIVTSDGRHLTGSQLNYAWVLIDRAETACSNFGEAAASVHIRAYQALIHPSGASPSFTQ